MKPSPAGWPRLSSAAFYDDARAAIDWLCRAFGFEARLVVEGDGGAIEHSELVFGEALVMVGVAARPQTPYQVSPRSLNGANTQSLCIYVDDVDAHCARARAVGARITREPTTSDYGEEYWADRGYEAVDPEGHRWYFVQRMRDPVRK
jgi:uncharacterized glyoxalase superfamily protein PhnB